MSKCTANHTTLTEDARKWKMSTFLGSPVRFLRPLALVACWRDVFFVPFLEIFNCFVCGIYWSSRIENCTVRKTISCPSRSIWSTFSNSNLAGGLVHLLEGGKTVFSKCVNAPHEGLRDSFQCQNPKNMLKCGAIPFPQMGDVGIWKMLGVLDRGVGKLTPSKPGNMLEAFSTKQIFRIIFSNFKVNFLRT